MATTKFNKNNIDIISNTPPGSNNFTRPTSLIKIPNINGGVSSKKLEIDGQYKNNVQKCLKEKQK